MRIILLLVITALLILISISCKKDAEITTNSDTTYLLQKGKTIVTSFDFLISVFVFNQAKENFELTDATLTVFYNKNDSLTVALTAKTNQISVKDNSSNYTLKVTKQDYENYFGTFTQSKLKENLNKPFIIVLKTVNN